MTEEELKKAMSKVIIFVIIMLILMIILAIFIFNDMGKSTTIFKNEEQKKNFENILENKENENISQNDIAEIEGNLIVDENSIIENSVTSGNVVEN